MSTLFILILKTSRITKSTIRSGKVRVEVGGDGNENSGNDNKHLSQGSKQGTLTDSSISVT